MKQFSLALLLFLFGSLFFPVVGCTYFKRLWPTPPAVPTAKVGAPLDNVRTSTAEANRKAADQDLIQKAKLLANLQAVQGEIPNFPEGSPKMIADAELTIARQRLGPIVADSTEIAATQARKTAFDQGRVEDARRLAETGVSEAKATQAALVQAQVEARLAKEREDKAVETMNRELEANRLRNQKIVDDLKAQLEAEKRAFLKWVGKALTGVGILLILFGGFLIYSGVSSGSPFKSIVKAICCFVGAAVLIGLAIIINEPWFITACVVGFILIAAAVAAYLWSETKEAKERKVLDVDATRAERTLKILTKVIEDNPESTIRDVKAKLSADMDSDDKALIHEMLAITTKERIS